MLTSLASLAWPTGGASAFTSFLQNPAALLAALQANSLLVGACAALGISLSSIQPHIISTTTVREHWRSKQLIYLNTAYSCSCSSTALGRHSAWDTAFAFSSYGVHSV